MSDLRQRAEKPSCDVLRVVCPECGRSAAMPWDKLHHRVHCCYCRRWYRLDPAGLVAVERPANLPIDVAVRSGFSEWTEHQLADPRPRHGVRAAWFRFVRSLRRYPARWTALGVALASLSAVTALVVARLSDSDPAVAALPNALEARIPLWADAWLRQDVGRMLRFTEPARDRELRCWLSRNRLPSQRDAEGRSQAEVQLASVEMRRDHSAQVTVRIQVRHDDGRQTTISQKEIWGCKDGTWYFVPRTAAARRPN